jgi:hypothetical protein
MKSNKKSLIFIPAELQNERGFRPDVKKTREKISKQVEQFLTNGGKIQHCHPAESGYSND